MKTRVLIVIIAGMFTTIAISSVAIAFMMSTYDTQNNQVFSYDIDPDSLITRNVQVSANIAIEEFPDKVCYDITDKQYKKFPQILKQAMADAKKKILNPEQIAKYGKDYFFYEDTSYFNGGGGAIHPVEALDFLREYSAFKFTEKPTTQNIMHIDDAGYSFECDITYGNDDAIHHQYRISFRFDSLYPSWENYVVFDIGENKLGEPTIKNPDATVYHTFNSTVLFANNLEYDVILSRQDDGDDDGKAIQLKRGGLALDEITIPPGQSWSHTLRVHDLVDDNNNDSVKLRSAPFNYEIQPGDIRGKITVKYYPHCMTEQEASSLYSQVGMTDKVIIYPSYLPAGYSFGCGIHNMNAFLHTTYLDGNLQSEYGKDPVNAAFSRQFFLDGGIRIDYYDEYILSGWIADKNYNKYEKVLEQTENSWLMTTYIDDNPALLRVEFVRDERTGEAMPINRLEVFLDDQKHYTIKSGLPFTEIKKIMESILFQKKFAESPEISHVLIKHGESRHLKKHCMTSKRF